MEDGIVFCLAISYAKVILFYQNCIKKSKMLLLN